MTAGVQEFSAEQGQPGHDITATLIDDLPAVRQDEWLYLLIPRSMHAIRVPASEQAAAPWRKVLAEYPSIATNRLYRPQGTPWGVTLVVSHRCNLSCVYCFSEVGHSTASLEVDRMLAIVDHTLAHRPAGRARPFVVNFFGGEPTLNMPDVEQVVRHVEQACASAGVQHSFRMVTNGTAPLSAMRFLVEHGFQLTVSMDAKPELQGPQRIYRKGLSPTQTVDTIKFLVDNGISPRIRSTVTGETVHHMAETVAYFAGLGATFIHFEPVGPSGTSSVGRLARYTTPTAEDYSTNLLRALDAARPLNAGVFGYAYQHLLSSPPKSYCEPMSGVDSYNVLNASGELIMCPEMQDPARNDDFQHNVGRVSGRRTVTVDITRKEDVGKLAVPVQVLSCQTCYARDICKSGCPSRNIQATGSLTKLDPYSCAVAKRVCADILGRMAQETFGAVAGCQEPILRPLAMPAELCTPPIVANAISVLQRAKIVFALTGETLAPQVHTEIERLTQLAGLST